MIPHMMRRATTAAFGDQEKRPETVLQIRDAILGEEVRLDIVLFDDIWGIICGRIVGALIVVAGILVFTYFVEAACRSLWMVDVGLNLIQGGVCAVFAPSVGMTGLLIGILGTSRRNKAFVKLILETFFFDNPNDVQRELRAYETISVENLLTLLAVIGYSDEEIGQYIAEALKADDWLYSYAASGILKLFFDGDRDDSASNEMLEMVEMRDDARSPPAYLEDPMSLGSYMKCDSRLLQNALHLTIEFSLAE